MLCYSGPLFSVASIKDVQNINIIARIIKRQTETSHDKYHVEMQLWNKSSPALWGKKLECNVHNLTRLIVQALSCLTSQSHQQSSSRHHSPVIPYQDDMFSVKRKWRKKGKKTLLQRSSENCNRKTFFFFSFFRLNANLWEIMQVAIMEKHRRLMI